MTYELDKVEFEGGRVRYSFIISKEAETMEGAQVKNPDIDEALSCLAEEVSHNAMLIDNIEGLLVGSIEGGSPSPEGDMATIDSAIYTLAKNLSYRNKQLSELTNRLREKIGDTKILVDLKS